MSATIRASTPSAVGRRGAPRSPRRRRAPDSPRAPRACDRSLRPPLDGFLAAVDDPGKFDGGAAVGRRARFHEHAIGVGNKHEPLADRQIAKREAAALLVRPYSIQ